MGLSSKKKTQTSTQTTAPSAYAQPFVSDAAAKLAPAYDEQRAVEQQFRPGLLAASKYYGDVQDGKYLEDGNPYLEGVISSSNRDITDAVNGQFNSRFGSAYHTNALVRGLGENENRLRYGNYATERGYQNDAGRNMAGIAATATGLAGLPAEQYAQNVNGLLGGYMTQDGKVVQKQSGGALGGLLGSVLSGWASGGFKR